MLADLGDGQGLADVFLDICVDSVEKLVLVILTDYTTGLRGGGHIFALEQAYDGLGEKTQHETIHVRYAGGAFPDEGFDEGINFFIIRKNLVDQRLIPVVGDILGQVFHIKQDGDVGNRLIFIGVLGVVLAGTVDDHFLFAQLVEFFVHFGVHDASVDVSQLEEIMLFYAAK